MIQIPVIELKETSAKTRSFDSVVTRILKLPIMKVADIPKQDLIDDTIDRGWRRFKYAVKDIKVDDDTAKVLIDDSAHEPLSSAISPLTPNQLATFLDKGTISHMVKPVNAKALRWESKTVSPKGLSAKMKTGVFFSKGHKISGIKATNFWRLMDKSKKAMNEFISNWIKTAANK